ncbi:MAG: phosphate acyltransferase PlsX [Actinomycetes bacterium]
MSRDRVTIALDAMGGDRAPGEIVAGALDAARDLGVEVRLYGRAAEVLACIPGGTPPPRVTVVDCPDVVGMGDEPAAAVRRLPESSVVRAALAVREGEADALVSAGNTGAAMAAALLRIGRIRGIARPAIAVAIPVPGSHHQVLLDAGATVDADPDWLVQFARMGREYAATRWGLAEPRIGLLSNGGEAGKGDTLRKEVFDRLRDEPGFIGNVEGTDLMVPGGPDVIVTDGFSGNLVLKTLEAALRSMSSLVFSILTRGDLAAVGEQVIPSLLEGASLFDPDLTGGALLMGVAGVVVISHGSSSSLAIVNACRLAADCVRSDIVGRLDRTVVGAG